MEKVQGFIDHFIYKNEQNGYGVIELHTEEEDIICVGSFPGIDQGETVEICGEYVEHAVYGTQIKVSSVVTIAANDILDIERYLGSGAVKGVGPSLAKRIVKKFKAETIHILEEEPERLAEVKGISERMAGEIASYMENKKELREAIMFLQHYGISNTLALKIYDTYGNQVYHILKENPYRLAEDMDGIGFKRADEIAKMAGINTDSEFRMMSGICYMLNHATMGGHVYLPKEELLARTSELLLLDASQVDKIIPNLVLEKKIVVKQEGQTTACYLSSNYYEELACARMLHELNFKLQEQDNSEKINKKITQLEEKNKIQLDELQRKAVCMAVQHGIFILSGGPGTGKTTTINTMISYFEKEGLDIMLAAPTGRAAKRMTEATGFEAKTIHRLLELNGAFSEDKKRAKFEKNEDNPLEADVIIIDEMSMVDIHLFYALLRAVPLGARLILVGDMDQLPSVGPGQVLRDLVESQAYPLVVLQKIFRQAGESDIVVNAHKINQGLNISLDNKSRDFFFLARDNANVIYKHMILLILNKLPGYIGTDSSQIQVLTPMRKGILGSVTLNGILQKYLNPPSPEKKEHLYGDYIFRENDKVMQIKNNYQLEWEIIGGYEIPIDRGLGVFNGDMGIILSISEVAQTLTVEFDDKKRVAYHFSQLDEIEPAYAVTIHKSQGSEYPAVIIPLLGGPRQLLNRNLLYTGITRARKCVTLIGSKATIETMIQNGNENKRYTGFKTRIGELEDIVRKEQER